MEPTTIFRSTFRPYLRLCTRFAAIGSPALIAAAAIGQWRGNRFPAYPDLLLSALMPVLAALAVGALFYLAVRFFTVKVLPYGLRCYDLTCIYQTVKWEDIASVVPVQSYGLPYLFIAANGLKRPITLPLLLNEMAGFVSLVESYAGSDNPLVRRLREAT